MTKNIFFGIGDEFLKREHLSTQVEPWEDGFRTDPRQGEFEWWYFDANFSDGSKAVIVFYTKSIINPKAAFKPAITLTITRPDGTKLFASTSSSPDDFSASTKSLDVRIGKQFIKGDLHTIVLNTRAEGLAADLTFTGKVPAWRPGTGKNYYDPQLKSYFAWLPAIPFGIAEGTLTYDGVTHSVNGSGYHDHNWGNIRLPGVLSHWYWGRAQVGDFSTIFVEMNAVKNFGSQKIPVFLVAKGDQILTDDSVPLKLATAVFIQHPSGHSYPQNLDFHWQTQEETITIRLRNPQVIESSSLLGFMPAWKQKLIRLFTNPYYFRFSAEMILDVNLKEVKAREQGNAIYELMLLH